MTRTEEKDERMPLFAASPPGLRWVTVTVRLLCIVAHLDLNLYQNYRSPGFGSIVKINKTKPKNVCRKPVVGFRTVTLFSFLNWVTFHFKSRYFRKDDLCKKFGLASPLSLF